MICLPEPRRWECLRLAPCSFRFSFTLRRGECSFFNKYSLKLQSRECKHHQQHTEQLHHVTFTCFASIPIPSLSRCYVFRPRVVLCCDQHRVVTHSVCGWSRNNLSYSLPTEQHFARYCFLRFATEKLYLKPSIPTRYVEASTEQQGQWVRNFRETVLSLSVAIFVVALSEDNCPAMIRWYLNWITMMRGWYFYFK